MYVLNKKTNVVYHATEKRSQDSKVAGPQALNTPGFDLVQVDEHFWIPAYQLVSDYKPLHDDQITTSAALAAYMPDFTKYKNLRYHTKLTTAATDNHLYVNIEYPATTLTATADIQLFPTQDLTGVEVDIYYDSIKIKTAVWNSSMYAMLETAAPQITKRNELWQVHIKTEPLDLHISVRIATPLTTVKETNQRMLYEPTL